VLTTISQSYALQLPVESYALQLPVVCFD